MASNWDWTYDERDSSIWSSSYGHGQYNSFPTRYGDNPGAGQSSSSAPWTDSAAYYQQTQPPPPGFPPPSSSALNPSAAEFNCRGVYQDPSWPVIMNSNQSKTPRGGRNHSAQEFFDLFQQHQSPQPSSSQSRTPNGPNSSQPKQRSRRRGPVADNRNADYAYDDSYSLPTMVYSNSSQNAQQPSNSYRDYNGYDSAPKSNYKQSRSDSQKKGQDRLYRQPGRQNRNNYLLSRGPNTNATNSRAPPSKPWSAEPTKFTERPVHTVFAEPAATTDEPSKNQKPGNRSNPPSSQLAGASRPSPSSSRSTRPNKTKENWRQRGNNTDKSDLDNVTGDQRERLTEQLYRGLLECLVCYERIRQHERVWACGNCFHVLHLDCIVKWVNSSTESTSGESNGWRCPACQNVTRNIPTEYKCMCGKVRDPKWVRGETPHCCGQICGRQRGCPHPCTLLCHPGPCPQCCANVDRRCGCGRTSQVVLCSSTVTIECENVCSRSLNCEVHSCADNCHQGDCKPCSNIIHQNCYCGRNERDLPCNGSIMPPELDGPVTYSCDEVCGNPLDCSTHTCALKCHPPPCPPCPLSPSVLLNCQCGATPVPAGARKSCTDPVVVCKNTCNKELPCGPPDQRHRCKAKCHEGNCPPCDGVTSMLCRCGLMAREINCRNYSGNPEDTRCQKKCTKKRSCGKHKCNQMCCIDIDHVCPLPCNKSLTCGRHKCERLCHRGHCPPCLAASFDELRCECGKSFILPPIPCGTRPPECSEPCGRPHACDHTPLHSCHSASQCPPCTVLTSRYCYGAHEMRKTVPCHMGDYSCGRACGRALLCGHKCIKMCHTDDCLTEGEQCTQPCAKPRETACSHPCSAPCHPGKSCPTNLPCLAKIEVTCECGRRKVTRTCSENHSEYQRIATSLLASKMADVRLGKNVDPTDMSSLASKLALKALECDDECKLQARNLRLAIGLQIANPDISSKLHPRYSDTLKAWVKKDPRFCEMVHEKLSQLVQLAKTSKQRSRAYSFQSMGASKRQFIHEYCEHFGVEAVAYDPEPNRNVVATAYKDKCWLPSYSLMEVVQREQGYRKVVPSFLPSLKKDSSQESTKLVKVNTTSSGTSSGNSQQPSTSS